MVLVLQPRQNLHHSPSFIFATNLLLQAYLFISLPHPLNLISLYTCIYVRDYKEIKNRIAQTKNIIY